MDRTLSYIMPISTFIRNFVIVIYHIIFRYVKGLVESMMTSLHGKNYFFVAISLIFSISLVRSLQVTTPQSKIVVTQGDTAKIRWLVNTNEVLLAVRCYVNRKGLTNGNFGKLNDLLPETKFSRYSTDKLSTLFVVTVQNASISQDNNQTFELYVLPQTGDPQTSTVHLTVEKAPISPTAVSSTPLAITAAQSKPPVKPSEGAPMGVGSGVVLGGIIGAFIAGIIFILLILLFVYKYRLLCFDTREQHSSTQNVPLNI